MRAGITHIARSAFNCYVVHDAGAGAALIVDPGLPSNGRDARAAVESLHGTGSTPSVVCTHGHSDHVAGLPEACGGPDGVGYHLPAACEAWIRDEGDPAVALEMPGLREVVKIAPVLASQPFSLAALRELAPLASKVGVQADGMRVPFAPAGFLADGDVVPGTVGWEVIASPGHTADSTCYYHAESATLLSGDSILTHDGQAWFNPEHLLGPESEATETRLRGLAVEHLLPGHGRPLHGTDLLGRARSFREQPPGSSLSCRLSRRLGRWAR